MPVIGGARIRPGTGSIFFVPAPTESPVAETTSATASTALTTSPPPSSPSSFHSVVAAVTLVLPATVGASVAAMLASTGDNLLCLQVTAVATAEAQNYMLALYDGDPGLGGTLLYQATGITASNYSDNAAFFIPAPTSGHIWAQVTNIDADATSVALRLRYLALA